MLNKVQSILKVKHRLQKQLYYNTDFIEAIKYNIPYITFKKGDMSLDELQKAMNEDKIKLLTIHASKGLESPNVLMWGNFPVNEKPYLRNNDEIKVRYVRSN